MSRELTCSRCGAKFTCQPENISDCQCGAVPLSAEVRARIAAEHDDCLCAACLGELAGLHGENSPSPDS